VLLELAVHHKFYKTYALLPIPENSLHFTHFTVTLSQLLIRCTQDAFSPNGRWRR